MTMTAMDPHERWMQRYKERERDALTRAAERGRDREGYGYPRRAELSAAAEEWLELTADEKIEAYNDEESLTQWLPSCSEGPRFCHECDTETFESALNPNNCLECGYSYERPFDWDAEMKERRKAA